MIDPLDGTLMYSQAIPFFSISIALEYKKKPIVGVVYAPALNLLYHAEKGKGSYVNGKRIHVSKKTSNLFYLVSTDIIRNFNLLRPFEKKLHDRTLHIKDFGSCALSMSFVAEGKADACLEYGIKPCDIAAGIIIVGEAGGIVVNDKLKKATSQDKNIIAANKLSHILKQGFP